MDHRLNLYHFVPTKFSHRNVESSWNCTGLTVCGTWLNTSESCDDSSPKNALSWWHAYFPKMTHNELRVELARYSLLGTNLSRWFSQLLVNGGIWTNRVNFGMYQLSPLVKGPTEWWRSDTGWNSTKSGDFCFIECDRNFMMDFSWKPWEFFWC